MGSHAYRDTLGHLGLSRHYDDTIAQILIDSWKDVFVS